jgi:hypothetical protein
LYTLKYPKDGTKPQYLKQITPFIIPDAIYKKYISQYELLSYNDKKILGEYQGKSYRVINEYMISNIVNIDKAKWDTNYISYPFRTIFLQDFYNNLILEEFNQLYKKKSKQFIPSDRFTRKIKRTLSDIYIDGLGLYEYNVAKLNIQVKTLYNLTTKNILEHDLILFRGESYDEDNINHPIVSLIESKKINTHITKRVANIKEYKKNSIIENKGFVSCSLDPLTAIYFSGNTTCCLYRYFIQNGTPGFLTPPYDTEYSPEIVFEFECLFAPHKCKILDVHQIPIGQILETEDKQIYTIFDVQIIEILPLHKLR